MKQIYKGYGWIRKKPEIYGIPLKRESIETSKEMDDVMEKMPAKNSKVKVDGIGIY